METGPRVLVTGFEPFPGAPVNPTEWLVGALREAPPVLPCTGAFKAEMLPVAYQAVAARLSGIGADFRPDIAVHFGLAQECAGFRLERIARNCFVEPRADNLGFIPASGPICEGPDTLPSGLPLEAIHRALTASGFPAEWSDDAGGYLCNTVFTLSLARGAAGFEPTMSGFIHVPLLDEGMAGAIRTVFDAKMLREGAEIILRTCVAAYVATKENGPA